jgi:hypothetical protein
MGAEKVGDEQIAGLVNWKKSYREGPTQSQLGRGSSGQSQMPENKILRRRWCWKGQV